jgi:hypothetical protein
VRGVGFEPRTFSFGKRETSLRENSWLFSLIFSPPFLALFSKSRAKFYAVLDDGEVNFLRLGAMIFRFACERSWRSNVNKRAFALRISLEKLKRKTVQFYPRYAEYIKQLRQKALN